MTEYDSVAQDAQEEEVTSVKRPTRLMASLYLALGIGALVLASRPDTDTIARYLIGIAVEIGLAVAALIFMRLERLPIVETARLRIPTRRQSLLALAIVPGMWIAGVFLNFLSLLVLGYTTPVTPAMFPRNLLEAVALAVTTVIVAPLCEELMFRGYIQRAFERRSLWIGIIGGGLIFALYHLRFQGVFALIPIALALGYVAWRTQSLLPAIAMHAAYNTIATVILIFTSFLSMEAVAGLAGMVICLAVLFTPVSFVALWLLWRRTEPPREAAAPRAKGFLRWAWIIPMVILLGVYAYASVSEVIVGRFPERLITGPVELTPPSAWSESRRWHYTVQTPLGELLGTAECGLTPTEGRFRLSCEADYDGFDLTEAMPGLAQGFETLEDLNLDLPTNAMTMLRTEARSWTLEATWAGETLALREMTSEVETPDGRISYAYDAEADEITYTNGEQTAESTDPADDGRLLLPHEWAWRLSGMPLELPNGGEATFFAVDVTEDGGAGAGRHDALVQVEGGEPVWTPAGNFVTWRVSVTYTDDAGEEQTLTAWYDSEAPHTLVRYEDGEVSYVLSQIESTAREPAHRAPALTARK